MAAGLKNFADLAGETLVSVENQENRRIVFTLDTGEKYMLWHQQDCCESVTVEDVAGDLKDLVGAPLVKAEEVVSNSNPPGVAKEGQDSFTWTFYHLATVKGYVTIRWYGESNGWYSESVDFSRAED